MMFRLFFLLLCCCATMVGCGKSDEPGSPGASPPKDSVPLLAERARGADGEKAPGKTVRQPCAVLDPCFELRASAGEDLAAGKPGSFAITIRPKGEYHLNLEFPTSVSIKAPEAIVLEREEIGKKDAAVFGEQLIQFKVLFTPATAGAHQVESGVRFAVCTPEICVPKKETLTLELSVK